MTATGAPVPAHATAWRRKRPARALPVGASLPSAGTSVPSPAALASPAVGAGARAAKPRAAVAARDPLSRVPSGTPPRPAQTWQTLSREAASPAGRASKRTGVRSAPAPLPAPGPTRPQPGRARAAPAGRSYLRRGAAPARPCPGSWGRRDPRLRSCRRRSAASGRGGRAGPGSCSAAGQGVPGAGRGRGRAAPVPADWDCPPAAPGAPPGSAPARLPGPTPSASQAPLAAARPHAPTLRRHQPQARAALPARGLAASVSPSKGIPRNKCSHEAQRTRGATWAGDVCAPQEGGLAWGGQLPLLSPLAPASRGRRAPAHAFPPCPSATSYPGILWASELRPPSPPGPRHPETLAALPGAPGGRGGSRPDLSGSEAASWQGPAPCRDLPRQAPGEPGTLQTPKTRWLPRRAAPRQPGACLPAAQRCV